MWFWLTVIFHEEKEPLSFTWQIYKRYISVCGLFVNVIGSSESGWFVENELEYMWVEVIMVVFRVLSQYLPGGAERNHEILESG